MRDSTPLHWAAFSGAELTLNYIIAWGGNLNSVDGKGLTPLHLAVKSYKENRSTKGIKQLLIKGADRNALDFSLMKPIDYVPLPEQGSSERIDPLLKEIRSLLKEQWSLLGDCLMIRTTFKKQEKSAFTLVCYFCLMALSYTLLQLSSYKVVWTTVEQNNWEYLLYSSNVLFWICMSLCVVVWQSDPGYIKKDPKLNFVQLLDTIDPSGLCPECEVVRTPRCRHCTLCKRCVDRFDHHCPWVNNCIGKGNFMWFYAFVTSQSLFLASVIVLSVYCKSHLTPQC